MAPKPQVCKDSFVSCDALRILDFVCPSQGVILQLLEALAALHQHGVIHRDVKVDNIMLHWPSCRAKLLDFGLAVELS